MEFIDTHTHLFLPEFDSDRSSVIQQSIETGVKRMLLPNIDTSSVTGMLKLCEDFPQNCFPMIGLHPTSVKEDYLHQLEVLKNHLHKTKFYAIGEIGIDLYWDKTYFVQQCEAFLIQTNWALEADLPLVIHSRESTAELIDLLKRHKTPNSYQGVFHSFSGTIDQAIEVIELGFKLGINGTVTYKNSKLVGVLQEIEPEHLLLETDSPYLPPVPFRGKRNQSSYVTIIAQKIAEIKNMTIEEVANITTINAKQVFKLS